MSSPEDWVWLAMRVSLLGLFWTSCFRAVRRSDKFDALGCGLLGGLLGLVVTVDYALKGDILLGLIVATVGVLGMIGTIWAALQPRAAREASESQ